MSKDKFNLYQTVTDKIIASIESGVMPWVCPWDRSKRSQNFDSMFPMNAKTRYAYRGVNVLLLWMATREKGYSSNQWLSYKQAVAMGGQVRKGEKSETVVYWSFVEKVDESTGLKKKIPFLKYYNVFNVEQIDGLELKEPQEPVKPVQTWEDATEIERLIGQTGAKIKHSGEPKANFQPAFDYINMPLKDSFKKPQDYYATLFHELTHWTGHHSRLNRQFGKRFGDNAYAFEELIAEMGSAFLYADTGLEGEVQHASYIDGWLKVLKADNKAIFKASTEAQKAHKFLTEGAQVDETTEEMGEAA